jgi:phosphate-selective porin OprO/OprP
MHWMRASWLRAWLIVGCCALATAAHTLAQSPSPVLAPPVRLPPVDPTAPPVVQNWSSTPHGAVPIASAVPNPQAGDIQLVQDPTSNLPAGDGDNNLETLRKMIEDLRGSHSDLNEALKKESAKLKEKEATSPSMRVTSELQLDDYVSDQTPQNQAAVGEIPDGMAFRRARAGILGDYANASYRLEMDFAEPGRPTFLDVWAAIEELPIVGQVKVGNFFEPIGLDRLTSNRYVTFMERNLADQAYTPNRNPGIQAMNHWDGDNGTWAIGAFRPHTDQFGDGVAWVSDRSVTGRVTWLPYFDEPSGGRYYTHLGAAFSYRTPPGRSMQFQAQPEARLGAAVPNIPFFINTGTFNTLSFELFGLEFARVRGPWHVQSEATFVPVQRTDGPDALFFGAYGETGYFLTGEHRPYRRQSATFDRVKPFTNFFRVRTDDGVKSGWGAWQIAARLSYVNLTDAGILGGRLTDVTLGLNWYLNPFMRVTSDIVHPMLVQPGTGFSSANICGVRMQFEY